MSQASVARSRRRNRPFPLRLRFTVASRLMLALSATAALSVALAMALHDRTLAADLEHAAQERLARAGQAARRLVEGHLDAMRERYRAISRTPQLRATLEVDDAPTLAYYAHTLQEREGAALLAFFDRRDRQLVASGAPGLLRAARGVRETALVAHDGHGYAVVSAELHTSAGRVGRMLAAERVEDATLAHWSELCGATVSFAPPGRTDPQGMTASALALGELDLRVAGSLDAERAALERSRLNLAAAGSIAVVLSLGACVLLARGFVRPIRSIQLATDRIRRGDLSVRIESQRRDEFGDVARAFDLMLDGLGESRREIERRVSELRQSQEHLANAQQIARLGSFEIDFEKDRPIAIRGSEQLRTLLQLAPGDGPIEPDELVARVHRDDLESVRTALEAAYGGGNALRLDFRLCLPDGTERIVHVQAQLAERPEQRRRLEGTLQDVTDRRRADEQIRYLSHHDALTGLGNRLLFSERLELAIAQAGRRGARVGVLFVDLDQFKRINDTLGPSAGDELLRRVADRLVRSLRDTDLVARRGGRDSAISRLGGDEFTLLIDDIGDAQDLALVASRLIHVLSRPHDLKGHEVVLGASVGIAAWPNDGENVDALLTSAGSAMRHAKLRGGNRYAFYDESMNRATAELLELESRMRHALARGEFEMHYQPKVALGDGRVTGFEALIRWRDPQAGLRAPNAFIPVAEQCGLIVPLGEFALRAACRQLAVWQRDRSLGTVPHVAVNLSPHQFKTDAIVESVRRILEETGALPEHLELEITETAVLHDERGVVADLERLRAMGIAISLDDFGTGQSSLSHLRRLPVDTLKIDMSFVRSIGHSREDARLTAAIVAMGRARGLCVVAEGVETEVQRRLLADWGCDEIQGFLISPALPAEQAIELAAGPVLDC